MEWVVFGILLVFGYVQTDRLSEEKNKTEKLEQVLENNVNAVNEAVAVNKQMELTLNVYKQQYSQCSSRLEILESDINRWKEQEAKNEYELSKFKNELNKLHYPDSCRLPVNLDIKNIGSTSKAITAKNNNENGS
jgi:hypothetical protein